MMMERRSFSRAAVARFIVSTFAIILVVAVPSLLPSSWVFLLALVGAFSIISFAMVILMGHGHQFHLGFAGVMALGAYSATVLRIEGFNLPVSLFIALLAGLAAGLVLGYLARWFGAFAVAIVTFGFGIFVAQAVRFYEPVTGGIIGLAVPPLPTTRIYFVVWALVGLSAWWSYTVLNSWIGRGIRAVRDNELIMEFFGYPSSKSKFLAFVTASPLISVGGALYAILISYMTPGTFGIQLSLAFIAIVIIGGATSLIGAVLGSAVWVILPDLTAAYPGVFGLVFGGLAIAVLIWAPGGLAGGLRALTRRVPGLRLLITHGQTSGEMRSPLNIRGSESKQSGIEASSQ